MMDGIVIIDKPKGFTSHDIVQRVKKALCVKKAGHTGTLDPLATGVLAVCLNSATKLVSRLMDGMKIYEVEILFGTTTDTYDVEGKILSKNDVSPNLEKLIRAELPKFTGSIMQVPPFYSAIKYKGKPLYKWAREGEFIQVSPREVTIEKFKLISVENNIAKAKIVCSKGTYIRSICHDLGVNLGFGACMQNLRRLETSGFCIENSHSIDEIEKSDDKLGYIVDIMDILKGIDV